MIHLVYIIVFFQIICCDRFVMIRVSIKAARIYLPVFLIFNSPSGTAP